jgi:general secretion pathway protein K
LQCISKGKKRTAKKNEYSSSYSLFTRSPDKLILISVLGALGIIYVMVIQLAADSMFAAQYYDRIMFRERAYYISRSAFSGVTQLFSLDDTSFDSLQDQWAYGLPQYYLDGEQLTISVTIEDQERYFNPNSIMKDSSTVNERNLRQFKKLLEILELNPEMSNGVTDWINAGSSRTFSTGMTGFDFPGVLQTKGGIFDSLEEMKFIPGFENDVFMGRISSGRAVPGLRDVLSIHTNGYINVNTARSEVLQSLDDDMTPDLVAELIRRREEKPFRKMDDLMELPGMNHDLLYRIKHLSDVKSEYFKITFTVENSSNDSVDLVVIMKRSGSSGKIVFWQAG